MKGSERVHTDPSIHSIHFTDVYMLECVGTCTVELDLQRVVKEGFPEEVAQRPEGCTGVQRERSEVGGCRGSHGQQIKMLLERKAHRALRNPRGMEHRAVALELT